MGRIARHVALPAAAPAAVVGLYFTPVATFGCAARGLMAFTVVLMSAAAALVTVSMAFQARSKRDRDSSLWWILSTAILTLPLALILGPLR